MGEVVFFLVFLQQNDDDKSYPLSYPGSHGTVLLFVDSGQRRLKGTLVDSKIASKVQQSC